MSRSFTVQKPLQLLMVKPYLQQVSVLTVSVSLPFPLKVIVLYKSWQISLICKVHHTNIPDSATQNMIAVTPSKQCIHFFLSDL
jgi:hypothetical protein